MAQPVWVVDASTIVQIKSSIPLSSRPAVFTALTALAAAGRLVFPSQVSKELKRDAGNLPPDAACQWAMSVEATACAVEATLAEAKEILAAVPDILDPKKDSGVDEADPYVIALARKLQG